MIIQLLENKKDNKKLERKYLTLYRSKSETRTKQRYTITLLKQIELSKGNHDLTTI